MKTKLFYIILFLISFSCKQKVVPEQKTKKIVVHTFIGKGEDNEITNWFYIKNIADGGLSGYYLETSFKVRDFKQANFVYSKTRPLKFKEQYASGEAIQFLDPKDLPDTISNGFPVESSYLTRDTTFSTDELSRK